MDNLHTTIDVSLRINDGANHPHDDKKKESRFIKIHDSRFHDSRLSYTKTHAYDPYNKPNEVATINPPSEWRKCIREYIEENQSHVYDKVGVHSSQNLHNTEKATNFYYIEECLYMI